MAIQTQGGHWERHLTVAIKASGGQPIPNHPSSFWYPEFRLLLTVYVDDLILSGPECHMDTVWNALRKHPIDLEDPEPLSRFLGRTHEYKRL